LLLSVGISGTLPEMLVLRDRIETVGSSTGLG